MSLDAEERYERRAPFGVPFAESFGLHLLIIGALASSVWLHSRIRGNEWGQNLDGAIQANLVSNAPSIPLPQLQKPTDNVLATENPSPAPAIEKEQTVPAPDLKAIPIPVKQTAKKEPPKKDVTPKEEQKHPQPQKQPQDRAHFGEQQQSSLPQSMAQQQAQAPAAPVSVTGGGGFRFPYYVAIIQRKTQENWLKQEVDPSTPGGAKAYIYFTLSRDGAPSDVKVGESSGSASLDQSCLRAVQRVDSYGPLPSGYNGSTLQVSYYCEFTGR
ncbi:MAG: TonB family protein [Acidobacteriaceae bacterium]|jgi:periplasmic protein TonB